MVMASRSLSRASHSKQWGGAPVQWLCRAGGSSSSIRCAAPDHPSVWGRHQQASTFRTRPYGPRRTLASNNPERDRGKADRSEISLQPDTDDELANSTGFSPPFRSRILASRLNPIAAHCDQRLKGLGGALHRGNASATDEAASQPSKTLIQTRKVTKLYCVYGAGDFVMMAPMAVIAAVFRMDEYNVRRVIKETRAGGESRVHFNGRPNALCLAIVIVEA